KFLTSSIGKEISEKNTVLLHNYGNITSKDNKPYGQSILRNTKCIINQWKVNENFKYWEDKSHYNYNCFNDISHYPYLIYDLFEISQIKGIFLYSKALFSQNNTCKYLDIFIPDINNSHSFDINHTYWIKAYSLDIYLKDGWLCFLD